MSVLTCEKDGHVAIVRIERPDALNALGREGDGELASALCGSINVDAEIRCVLVTGAGNVFCAGGDLKAMLNKSGSFAGSGIEVRQGFRRNIHRLIRAFYDLEMPVVAAINGPAIGLGCDLAVTADVRLAADTASFGVPFVSIGLVPGDGGAWLLPRAIGPSRAAELFFTGDRIDASTAERWGLVSQVVPAERLMETALSLARRISAQPGEALRLTKAMMRQAIGSDFQAALEASASNQALLCQTADHEEGVRAVLEGRPPIFPGC